MNPTCLFEFCIFEFVIFLNYLKTISLNLMAFKISTCDKERGKPVGGFAKCYEITDSSTKNVYAGKIVSKNLLSQSNHRMKMAQEIEIHKALSHKHIVQFIDFFEDHDFVFVVLELCRKRSLMELHKRRKALTEPEVRFFMKQILNGVSYLHENKIIHRDLKLGNIFLNDNMEVKIGDFGLAAKIIFQGERKQTVCGTPNYIAPEIITKKGHSFEVDIWSIGCIMYTLLVGKPPFETKTLRETYSKIKRCDYELPSFLNKDAAHMVHEALLPDPIQRPSVKRLIDMEFLKTGFCPKELPASCLTTAPRFDSIKDASIYNRKPLVEVSSCNNIQDSLACFKKPEPRESMFTSGNAPIIYSSKTSQCQLHLQQLQEQLQDLLQSKPTILLENDAEDMMMDPDAQPFVWISKWVDYSDKYGFGYQLCDDGVGVMFNDNTKLVLLANQRNVHYIERDGSEHYHLIGSTPPSLEKKMKLLGYFRRYMSEHLLKAGASVSVQESDSLSRMPYLHLWNRFTFSVIMQLTNGTVQINFQDHTKIIMCPFMAAVTYIDAAKNFRTYRFKTIKSKGCVDGLATGLKYAYRKISAMIENAKP